MLRPWGPWRSVGDPGSRECYSPEVLPLTPRDCRTHNHKIDQLSCLCKRETQAFPVGMNHTLPSCLVSWFHKEKLSKARRTRSPPHWGLSGSWVDHQGNGSQRGESFLCSQGFRSALRARAGVLPPFDKEGARSQSQAPGPFTPQCGPSVGARPCDVLEVCSPEHLLCANTSSIPKNRLHSLPTGVHPLGLGTHAHSLALPWPSLIIIVRSATKDSAFLTGSAVDPGAHLRMRMAAPGTSSVSCPRNTVLPPGMLAGSKRAQAWGLQRNVSWAFEIQYNDERRQRLS